MSNDQTQLRPLTETIQNYFGIDLEGKRLALWAADENAAELIRWLVNRGASLCVHSHPAFAAGYQGKRVEFKPSQWEVVRGADALIIVGNASIYRGVEPGLLGWFIGHPVVFDLGNILDAAWFRYGSFTHFRGDDRRQSVKTTVRMPFPNVWQPEQSNTPIAHWSLQHRNA